MTFWKVSFQHQTETINPWVNNLLLSHCYPVCSKQMGICLFFLSVEERTATNWRYPRIVDFWLQSHIIGALLVFKVTERQASASYIRKPCASLEWNIWLLVGAPAVSRKSWEASSWQTGSRRRMGQRWREWVRIIGPFLPFSDSGQYFCHGFPSNCVWHFASAPINPHATLRNTLICAASAIWLNTKCLSELCQRQNNIIVLISHGYQGSVYSCKQVYQSLKDILNYSVYRVRVYNTKIAYMEWEHTQTGAPSLLPVIWPELPVRIHELEEAIGFPFCIQFSLFKHRYPIVKHPFYSLWHLRYLHNS